jgi:hypothetical protein
MTDFAAGQGQYSSWRDDHAKRRALVRDVFRLLKRRTHKSFSVGVIIGALNEVLAEYEMPETHSRPYPIAAIGMIRHAHDWIMRNSKDSDRQRFVFELGDPDTHLFVRLLQEIGWPAKPAFETKKSCTPLQAADFIAWQHARMARYTIKRAAWGDILDEFVASHNLLASDAWGIIDKPQLLSKCTERRWPRRTSGGSSPSSPAGGEPQASC